VAAQAPLRARAQARLHRRGRGREAAHGTVWRRGGAPVPASAAMPWQDWDRAAKEFDDGGTFLNICLS
jgi:hypothetical protein